MSLIITKDAQIAAKSLHQAGIIACPTEGVWGLSCLPDQPDAVKRLRAIKQRIGVKPFILAAGRYSYLAPFWPDDLSIPSQWPGPYTFVVPCPIALDKQINPTDKSIALRWTNHPLFASLSIAANSALVTTSLNVKHEGQSDEVESRVQAFCEKHAVDVLLQGELGGLNKPSTLIDLVNQHTIRP